MQTFVADLPSIIETGAPKHWRKFIVVSAQPIALESGDHLPTKPPQAPGRRFLSLVPHEANADIGNLLTGIVKLPCNIRMRITCQD